MATIEGKREEVANGAALASFLAAGIGAFALGLIVILNSAGVFVAPALYAPAGGVSGRTTLAAVIWLIGWAVLHSRWKGRQIESRRVHAVTLILIGLGVLLTFPPVWKLL
jgi:multisubunit Na+/H+ antiporter MnhG subunit